MTSVDELFKKPLAPSGVSLKRKLEASDAAAAYKATKLSSHASPNGRSSNGVSVEDAREGGEKEEDDDVEAGPALPPEADDGAEDEEGRFFGGGVSKDTTDALDYLDKQDGSGEYSEERIDSAWLRRLTTSFERKVTKNAELRAKHAGDPRKFMQSEADLDGEVKSWSLLSGHPELYVEFAESGAPASIVGLVAHENTDIAIAAIRIISELLDEDVEAEQDQWDALVVVLLDVDLMELLMSNLSRLDETDETDQRGVYLTLSVIESLASQQSIAERIGTSNVLEWLCHRIKEPEQPCSENKQYAAETLQVLLQSSPLLRTRLAVDIDGVDLFLQLLATYRKRDPPKHSTEEEFVENVFDALTCVVDEPAGKTAFVEAEGVELCLIMLREGEMSRPRALRLMDHAASPTTSSYALVGAAATASAAEAATSVCEKIVDAGGIKTAFGLLKIKSGKKNKRAESSSMMEHLVGLLASMLRLLPGGADSRIRLVQKFVENELEKTRRLCGLRGEYTQRLDRARGEDSEVQMEFCRRTVDFCLAWLAAEEKAIKDRVLEEVGEEVLVTSLREQIEDLDPETGDAEETREMLDTLVGCLKGGP